jgi:hypothetical protein
MEGKILWQGLVTTILDQVLLSILYLLIVLYLLPIRKVFNLVGMIGEVEVLRCCFRKNTYGTFHITHIAQ